MRETQPHYMTFKSGEAAKYAGIKQEKLNQWVFKGLIVPDIESQGSGQAAGYSMENIVLITIIDALHRGGFTLKKASKIAHAVCGLDQARVDFETGEVISRRNERRLVMTIDVKKGFLLPVLNRFKAELNKVKEVGAKRLKEVSK